MSLSFSFRNFLKCYYFICLSNSSIDSAKCVIIIVVKNNFWFLFVISLRILLDSICALNKSGEIKTYLDSKQKVASTVSQLAEQSCLSLKHNKNQSKGENTWTGKIKKIKEINLREGEVNGFDIGTCKGMQQVMDLSNASILKQLALDESEYTDIIAEQRKLVTNLTTEKDSYKEICRILLRENLDLKDILLEKDLLPSENMVNLNELFSAFGDIETDEEVREDEQPNEIQDN